MFKQWFVFFLAAFSLLLTACSTTVEEESGPVLYERYDQRVLELREAVDREELSVSEAEELRRQAFLEYLEEVRQHRIGAQYRNY